MKLIAILTLFCLTFTFLSPHNTFAESTPAPVGKTTTPPPEAGYQDYNQLVAPSDSAPQTTVSPVTQYSPTASKKPPRLKTSKKKKNTGLSFKDIADGIQKKPPKKGSLSFKSLAKQVKKTEKDSPTENIVEKLKRQNGKSQPK
jgi:hypothetical protein